MRAHTHKPIDIVHTAHVNTYTRTRTRTCIRVYIDRKFILRNENQLNIVSRSLVQFRIGCVFRTFLFCFHSCLHRNRLFSFLLSFVFAEILSFIWCCFSVFFLLLFTYFRAICSVFIMRWFVRFSFYFYSFFFYFVFFIFLWMLFGCWYSSICVLTQYNTFNFAFPILHVRDLQLTLSNWSILFIECLWNIAKS